MWGNVGELARLVGRGREAVAAPDFFVENPAGAEFSTKKSGAAPASRPLPTTLASSPTFPYTTLHNTTRGPLHVPDERGLRTGNAHKA